MMNRLRWLLTVTGMLLGPLSLLPAQTVSQGQATESSIDAQRSALTVEREAWSFFSRGDHVSAETLFLEALAIRGKVQGKGHTDYTKCHGYLVGLYLQRGDYGKAESLIRDAMTYRESVLGKEHPDYATSLHQLASLYARTGDHTRAESLYLEALAIRGDVQGKEHPEYANSLISVAFYYRQINDHVKSEPLFLEASEIKAKVLGKEHPDYLNSRHYLAVCYASKLDFLRAESLHRETLALREKVLGKEHQDYADSLVHLAHTYKSMGDSSRAEPLYRESMTLRAKVLGKEHADYATSLYYLARLHESTGDYAQAEPLLLESLAIREKVFGKEHVDYANSLNDLAVLYEAMGEYSRSEPLFLEALAIRAKVLGNEHADYATSVHDLAALYQSMGDYEQSKTLYLESIAIREKLLGMDHHEYMSSLDDLASREKLLGMEHHDYMNSLNDLAVLFEEIGAYDRARPLYHEAMIIAEKIYGKDDARYAVVQHNLAALYRSIDDHERAKLLLQNALAVFEKVWGKEHPNYATGLNQLARVYLEMGDYASSESLFLETLSLRTRILGKEHPEYARSLHLLGTLYRSTRNHDKAQVFYQQGLAIFRAAAERSAKVQSERQQLSMGHMLRCRLDEYVSFGLDVDQFQAFTARELLRWKGSTLVRQRAMRLAADDPTIAERFQELQRVSRGLASLSRAIPQSEPPENLERWRARISELTTQRERLEAQLSSQSAVFRKATQDITLEHIQKSLPSDGVLIDYLQFIRSRPAEPREGFMSEESLLATIVLPQGEPVLVELGPLAPISAAIETWRQTFGMSTQGKAAGKQLRQLIWEPVLAKLAELDASRLTNYGPHADVSEISQESFADGILLISTDGVLGRLPLGGLPGKDPGTYLIEDHRLAMVPVPQLLPALVNNQDRKVLSRELLLLGDVDYDADPRVAAKEPSRRPRRAVEADQPFSPLEGTRGEIATIKKTYTDAFKLNPNDVATLERASATEARFRELAPQFYHLHLATHGFFAPESMVSALAPQEPKNSRSGRLGLPTENEQVRGYNPGLLSGLAFAGANRPPVDDADDGILTSQEIAFLPLGGVDTVVLSACETGLGNTAGGEGLLGVQRAFQIAGARTTVASLWKVDDLVTRVLMERFYRNLWEKEMPRLEALREAQLYVLNHPEAIRGATLEQGAEKQTRVSPFYWAAFTLSGDWR